MNNSRNLPLPIALESVFENSVLGSTGHWPVPSGDSPDGTAATARANGGGLFATLLVEVPVGESPTRAGGATRLCRPTTRRTERERQFEPMDTGLVATFLAAVPVGGSSNTFILSQ